MQPEISEFSYGFALTNEIVGWADLSAAPVFPSLIEEGKVGGGYDVKLDRPGAPLFLQFKRSERMERKSAREYRTVRARGGHLNIPFYRFPITEGTKSQQHEMLLALDNAPNLVYYVAPRFHRLTEINSAWADSAVASRSVFVAPNEIGQLDDNKHTVAFDGQGTWVCSDPYEIKALTARALLEKIQKILKDDDRPLRVRLPEIANELQLAEARGRERIRERNLEEIRKAAAQRREGPSPFALDETDILFREFQPPGYLAGDQATPAIAELPEPNPPTIRESKSIAPELVELRRASDIAARAFDTQLIIVQPT